MASARQSIILDIARHTGRVMVDDLATRLDVTPQTIRKDLNELCDKNLLSRVHGGAMLSTAVKNVGYEARRAIARDEKAAIGRIAAGLIPNASSLFINIGTTTEAVARALVHHANLMVVTNNINVANTLRPCHTIEVVIAGGLVRPADGGIVGEAAVDFIKQFRVDFAVIGTSAIDDDGALLDFDFREVKVAQAIIENARNVILVADSTKFDRKAPVRIAHISQVDTFVTDQCPSETIRRIAVENDVHLVETAPTGAEVG
ncbi:DeoR/GlpR transcriptional regulator [Rhizobiales bacterium]|uniref:DeoR/GlpR family DNA-binding transcription regulator n=1 Tax=Hongsoonwoonella zoysiae TaxID=2821844 RepID=UPI00155FEF66|nr:DeoR/GlpR family DNA-binding transcription regulator [Hongsoonwoonella zoysiae]NRG16186.1 DeoR/GlpR transcriptional regulator [Hongsoonwoonella zoysiae]